MTLPAASGTGAVSSVRARLISRYRSVRDVSDSLSARLTAEDCMVQSMPDASPTKWHLAHTTWFFDTFLLADRPGYEPLDPAFRVLYNSYYNAVGAQHPRPERGLVSRPSLDEVRRYRAWTDERLTALLEQADASELERLGTLVELGVHHEQQHQELLLMDIKHAFWVNPLRPAYSDAAPPISPSARPLRFLGFSGGVQWIGHAGEGFAFDNEGPRHQELLPAFRLASRPVSNLEYLEFMADGGYERAELWLSDGWTAARQQGWTAPLYWERRDGAWWHFTLHGMRPVALDAPVCHVSFFEADAFARWAGARLPTEQEWEVATAGIEPHGNTLDSGALEPLAARAAPDDRPLQLFGDVWEWTSSAYRPYPGYQPLAGALGEYNAKFMSSQMVLRGGCCVTPAGHVRPTYRNFFPPSARWVFAGVRLAEDV